MEKTNKVIAISSIIAVVLIALFVATMSSFQAGQSIGSAPSGLAARLASTSQSAITAAGTSILFASTTNCSARVITTYEEDITLTFSDYSGQTPTATLGHIQLSSTTVAYDGGIYGCGLVKAFSPEAQTLTVTDMQ